MEKLKFNTVGKEASLVNLLPFASEYNALKELGMHTTEIKDRIQSKYEIGNTTFYKYLQLCREIKLVSDTYAENAKRGAEARRHWLLFHNGNIKGVKFESISASAVRKAREGRTTKSKLVIVR